MVTDPDRKNGRIPDEEAEKIRKRYKYRRLIQSGKLVLPYKDAVSLLGPDTAYHLYSVKPYSAGGKGAPRDRRKTRRLPEDPGEKGTQDT